MNFSISKFDTKFGLAEFIAQSFSLQIKSNCKKDFDILSFHFFFKAIEFSFKSVYPKCNLAE